MGEWAKASIEKKIFKFKSGRVGSGLVGFRISSWLIIRKPRTVKWAKASIEKKNFKFKSGRVGSGRVGSGFESRAG